MELSVKFKKLNDKAVMPVKEGSAAGYSLTATSLVFDEQGCAIYGCGLAVKIPEGYVGLVLPLPNVTNKDLVQSDCCGVISPDNREELVIKFKPSLLYVDANDKVGQHSCSSRNSKGGTRQTDVNTQSVSYYGADVAYFLRDKEFIDGDLGDDYVQGRHPKALNPRIYKEGDKVAQLLIIPAPAVVFEEVKKRPTEGEHEKSERG